MYIRAISPPPALASVGDLIHLVRNFERNDLEAAIEELVGLLDDADGDPDVEANGDELDASGSAEEDWECIQLQGDGRAGAPEDAEDEYSDHCEAGDD